MAQPSTTAGEPPSGLPIALVHRDPGGGHPMSPTRRTPPARTTTRHRRLRLVLAVLLLAALAGGAAWLLAVRTRPAPEVPPGDAARLVPGPVASRLPPGVVVGLGKLVPRSRIVTVTTPYGAGDARIAGLPVEEGQQVAAGAVLAVLDSEPSLLAALASAEAAAAALDAAFEQARVTVASSREDARAALARAEAAIDANRRDLDRAATLIARGASTRQVVDQRRVAYEQAVQDAARAQAALLRYDPPGGATPADVLLAMRNADAGRADVARARADLEKARVRAPFAGTVLTLHARPGERPGEAGILTFGALDDMIAEVEVYENHLRDLAPGVPVTLSAAALGQPLAGRVARVGAEVLRQTLTDTSPAANTDSRVARVTVDLDAASAVSAARLPNLQVTARFETGGPRAGTRPAS